MEKALELLEALNNCDTTKYGNTSYSLSPWRASVGSERDFETGG